jgi:hypothetical protein
MPMERLVILLIFISNISFEDIIDDVIKTQTDILKSRGIEKIIVHQYSLFNGRYNIPYDNEELRCDNIPTVAHIFWLDGGQWNCLRLDKCGLFNVIKLDKFDFDNFTIDDRIKIEKNSPHFTAYKLTEMYGENSVTVLISGNQLTNERNSTIKTFKKINKAIKQLEKNHKFKRV